MAKQSKEEQDKKNGVAAVSETNLETDGMVATETLDGTTATDSGNMTLEGLQQLLEQEQKKSEDLLKTAQLARAEFLNLKRRTDLERATISSEAREKLLLKLLPVVDDFERAMATLPENLKGEAWINGVSLIENKLKKLLDQENVIEIPALDTEFNPHLHEAVYRDETGEGEHDWNTEVYQKGYKMGDKVIRHAMVKVGSK